MMDNSTESFIHNAQNVLVNNNTTLASLDIVSIYWYCRKLINVNIV